MATVPQSHDKSDHDWEDGELDGHYVETRQVTIRNGPSAGKTKLVFDFHVGLEDELVSVWETTVIRSKFREELKRRAKADFEPGERIVIRPLGKKTGPNGPYRDFHVEFEFSAPKPSALSLLIDEPGGGADEPFSPATDADDITF